MQTEIQGLLRELIEGIDAESAAIVAAGPGRPPCVVDVDGGELRRAALGDGSVLEVRFSDVGDEVHRAAAIERSVRAMRACLRRWGLTSYPPARVNREHPTGVSRDRVLERIEVFLQAFAGVQGVTNAIVTLQGAPLATAIDLTDDQRARLPFLLRQVGAEVEQHRGETSHVEILRDDACAFSFWFDACLIAFCDGNHSPDFLRHRARLVTREISLILPHLDEPPPEPAKLAPIPE